MNVDLSDEQTAALLGELDRIIEGDSLRALMRIRTLKEIPTSARQQPVKRRIEASRYGSSPARPP